jgi:hypothetical protein
MHVVSFLKTLTSKTQTTLFAFKNCSKYIFQKKSNFWKTLNFFPDLDSPKYFDQ